VELVLLALPNCGLRALNPIHLHRDGLWCHGGPVVGHLDPGHLGHLLHHRGAKSGGAPVLHVQEKQGAQEEARAGQAKQSQ